MLSVVLVLLPDLLTNQGTLRFAVYSKMRIPTPSNPHAPTDWEFAGEAGFCEINEVALTTNLGPITILLDHQESPLPLSVTLK